MNKVEKEEGIKATRHRGNEAGGERRVRSLFLVMLFVLVLGQAYGQDSLPSFVRDSLDGYVERSLKSWNIPGAAVCVVKDGKVVVMKGYGVTRLGTQQQVDANTLFMIGSNSKAITATALAMLEEEKKLSLDDKVTKWIPQFKLENKAAGEQAIIRDLLCHRIGFMTFQGDFTYWTSNLTREQVIEKMSHIKAVFPFRTKWGYTNAAFLTAGEIIPKASGLSWEEYLTKNIFKPLGMSRTIALSRDIVNATNKSTPHTYQDGKLIAIPYPAIDNLAPAGSISSSVNDLSKWVLMELNNGVVDGKQVIPLKALQQTWMPHSILGNGGSQFNRAHFNLYGLGWFLEEYEGRKIVSHTGGVNGFVTSVTLLPEEKLGIVVLTNTDQNIFFESLKWEILDAFLKLPYRNYTDAHLASFKSNMEQQSAADQKIKDSVARKLSPSVPLNTFAGNYSNDLYGKMSVALENGELRMRFSHHPHMYAKLESVDNDRFYATFSDPIFYKSVFPFRVENGRVTGVTVKVADFIEYGGYDFKKD